MSWNKQSKNVCFLSLIPLRTSLVKGLVGGLDGDGGGQTIEMKILFQIRLSVKSVNVCHN